MNSTATQPAFDPQNVVHWINVLGNAARVPKTADDYANAQAVVQLAKEQIGQLNTAANARENQPGLLPAAVTAFGQGASLGAASQIGDALQGFSHSVVPGQGGQQPMPAPAPVAPPTNSAYLSAARAAHPVATTAADIAGAATLGTALSPLVAGLTPAQGAFVLGGGMGAARGAVEPIPGLTRGESAAIYGTVGAVSGYVVGKAVSKLLPLVRQVATNVRGLFGKIAPENLGEISENAIRARLRQLNVNPEMIERTVDSWKTGTVNRTPIKPPIQMPPVGRPGETLTPIAPKGFAVEGPAPPVKPGPSESFWEQVYGPRVGKSPTLPDVGTGKVLPYYSRGGQVEQAFAPQPVTSPPVAGAATKEGQLAAIAQYLQSLTPAQVPDAIAAAKAIGIPLGGTSEQVMALLLGGR